MSSGRWLAADEVAVMLGRPVPTVYMLAQRRRWRRHRWNGRVYYHPDDVGGRPCGLGAEMRDTAEPP